ncbi:MAG: Xaa-Pro aminopeptidase [Candidatus Tokpelaia sp. JSC085]|nr:MAG: Xaa-Pro aminopeptidase [Candidatus Tokpelaia sp. JSC085]
MAGRFLMFQSFEIETEAGHASGRVAELRVAMACLSLDGFLVPHTDACQGIWISRQRLGWLTGFTGSTGIALILRNQAVIFVDGRYSLQIRQQTDSAVFSYENLVTTSPAAWLKQHTTGLKIGFDPWLHTISDARALREGLQANDGRLIAVKENLIDLIWKNQPEPPLHPVSIQSTELSGKTAKEKMDEIRRAITDAESKATILTDPSSIAWCFNIRGSDIAHTPLPLSCAIIPVQGKPALFIDKRKLKKNEKKYLQSLCTILQPSFFEENIIYLARNVKNILLDSTLIAEKLRLIIEKAGGQVREYRDPVQLLRAVKTPAELAGAHLAHQRDGVALVRFLSWLSRQNPDMQSEISTTQKLEELRLQTAEAFGSRLEDIAFDTISSSGPNSAIIHYRVNVQTNRSLKNGELYLVDSGAQYRDGTTDVTRTIAIGKVGDDAKRCFTLVLKGMIAISTAHFPLGTRGQDIDALARIALWKNGFDYAHSTGHGVGAFLAVHEGPQSISRYSTQILLPHMILSNEPGYYRKSSFGIRIENLLAVKIAAIPEGGELPMLSFETLTLCPIDKHLILPALLTKEERDWLNNYHDAVYKKTVSFLDPADQEWLIDATAPI